MNPSSDTAATLERERRLAWPAGIAAAVGALAIQVGFIVGGSAVSGDGTAERLLDAATGDSDGQLLAGAAISAVGFALLALPLLYLFLAARARAEQRLLVGLAVAGVLGALLVGAGLIVNYDPYLQAADDFAAAEAPAGESEDDADERADEALDEASGASTAQLLVRGGSLALGVGLFYTALWAMRTGLLTRFWGSLGMAAAVVLALFFLYFFALVWFLAMGFLIMGLWIGARPPAWETGRAIPWPKPGAPPPEEDPPPGGTIEGEGRELGPPGEGTPQPPAAPPRKRKRRDTSGD